MAGSIDAQRGALMTPAEVASRVYLGDRCCKAFDARDSQAKVVIAIDQLAVIPEGQTFWRPGTGTEIDHGMLEFSEVSHWHVTPRGINLCDWIEFESVQQYGDEWICSIAIGGIPKDSNHIVQCLAVIHCKRLSVIDPRTPNSPILMSD
jgi:hypothetical protein